MRKRKQEQEKDASAVNDEEKMAKADFDRVKERADLRHKTVSKKLKFYDNTNSKESIVVSSFKSQPFYRPLSKVKIPKSEQEILNIWFS